MIQSSFENLENFVGTKLDTWNLAGRFLADVAAASPTCPRVAAATADYHCSVVRATGRACRPRAFALPRHRHPPISDQLVFHFSFVNYFETFQIGSTSSRLLINKQPSPSQRCTTAPLAWPRLCSLAQLFLSSDFNEQSVIFFFSTTCNLDLELSSTFCVYYPAISAGTALYWLTAALSGQRQPHVQKIE